jgi:lipopolysaccharide transport system ATP-binding protein
MTDIVIKAEGLGKKYLIGHQKGNGSYTALRDILAQNARGIWYKTKDLIQGKPIIQGDTLEEMWALKDVCFAIQSGEAVGIIGRNGAGKSTLLKILSRITEPSTGRVTIKGRVASLLEVGTGFHPELTGRENIYLNGAILGMTRAEIKRKFDEIVAFAEVEQFLDTPVKRYSSGMYVRLAFAVAAHLEPEILVVDEVLAVGDAAFQKKCLGKMGCVAEEGRTVLFVSHNMQAISRLCQRAILLKNGKIVADDVCNDVVSAYLGDSSIDTCGQATLSPLPIAAMRLRSVSILNKDKVPVTRVEMGQPFYIQVVYDVNRPVSSAHVICLINNSDGVNVLSSGDTDLDEAKLGKRQPGSYRGEFQIPAFLLGEGGYSLTVALSVPFIQTYDRHEAIVSFEVVDNTSVRRQWQHKRRPGILGLEIPWATNQLEEYR